MTSGGPDFEPIAAAFRQAFEAFANYARSLSESLSKAYTAVRQLVDDLRVCDACLEYVPDAGPLTDPRLVMVGYMAEVFEVPAELVANERPVVLCDPCAELVGVLPEGGWS